jgi:hypothetical protein
MTDYDADSVVAYLQSLPPINHQIPPNEPPFDQGWPMPVTPLADSEIPMPRSDVTGATLDSALRGRYLAGKTSLCIDCHTPTVLPANLGGTDTTNTWKDRTKFFSGGDFFPSAELGNPLAMIDPLTGMPQFLVQVPNITSDATTGLAHENWTVADITNMFSTGQDNGMTNSEGTACATADAGPMIDAGTADAGAPTPQSCPPGSNQTCDSTGKCQGKSFVCAGVHGNNTSSTAALTDGDKTDIANYILSLPPLANMTDDRCFQSE